MEKLRFILTKNEIHFLIPYPSKNAIRGWVFSLQNKLEIANLVRIKKAQNDGVKSSIKPVKTTACSFFFYRSGKGKQQPI